MHKNVLTLLPYIVVFAAAIIPYISTWSDPFIADDWAHSSYSQSASPSDIASTFAFNGGDILYRPVSVVYFWINYQLWGLNPVGHHVVKGLLFALAAVLLYVFIKRTTGRGAVAFVAAMIFALHPLNACSAIWIATHANILCALFYFGALIFFVEARRSKSKLYYGAFLLAGLLCLGSYELGYSLPLMVLLTDFLLLESPAKEKFGRRLLWHLPYIVIAAAFLAARFALMGHGYAEPRPWIETALNVVAQTAEMAFLPAERTALPLSLWMRAIPPIVAGLLVVWILRRQKNLRRLTIFALVWIVAGLIPAKDIAMTAYALHTSRFLIVAMAGIGLLVGIFVEHFMRGGNVQKATAALCITVALGACFWRDREIADRWSTAADYNQTILEKIEATCQGPPLAYKIVFFNYPVIPDTICTQDSACPSAHVFAIVARSNMSSEYKQRSPYADFTMEDSPKDYTNNLYPICLDVSKTGWKNKGIPYESNRLSAENISRSYFFRWESREACLLDYTQVMRKRLSAVRTFPLPTWSPSDTASKDVTIYNLSFSYQPGLDVIVADPKANTFPYLLIATSNIKAQDIDYLSIAPSPLSPILASRRK